MISDGLVNQLAYAAWDAGNFSELSYSRMRLESLGLGHLESPYDNLKNVYIELLLPPVVEWRADGPYLALGGITAGLNIDRVDDTRAWTAARVPIIIALDEGRVSVLSDPRRSIITYPIMLDKLSVFAERKEVLKLMNIAIPAVINDVFSDIPLLSLSPLELSALVDSPTITVYPRPQSIEMRSDHWMMGLTFEHSTTFTHD